VESNIVEKKWYLFIKIDPLVYKDWSTCLQILTPSSAKIDPLICKDWSPCLPRLISLSRSILLSIKIDLLTCQDRSRKIDFIVQIDPIVYKDWSHCLQRLIPLSAKIDPIVCKDWFHCLQRLIPLSAKIDFLACQDRSPKIDSIVHINLIGSKFSANVQFSFSLLYKSFKISYLCY
jgi:hypothetical protein